MSPWASIRCLGNTQTGLPFLRWAIDVQLHFTCHADGWSVRVVCPYNKERLCNASYHEGVPCPLVGSAQRPHGLDVMKADEVTGGAAQETREARAQEPIKHTCEYCDHKGFIDMLYPGWPQCSHCHCSISLKALMALRYGESITK